MALDHIHLGSVPSERSKTLYELKRDNGFGVPVLDGGDLLRVVTTYSGALLGCASARRVQFSDARPIIVPIKNANGKAWASTSEFLDQWMGFVVEEGSMGRRIVDLVIERLILVSREEFRDLAHASVLTLPGARTDPCTDVEDEVPSYSYEAIPPGTFFGFRVWNASPSWEPERWEAIGFGLRCMGTLGLRGQVLATGRLRWLWYWEDPVG